jgi:hypothetical protein
MGYWPEEELKIKDKDWRACRERLLYNNRRKGKKEIKIMKNDMPWPDENKKKQKGKEELKADRPYLVHSEGGGW